MSRFTLKTPEARAIPVLVEVPHSGLSVPEVVADELLAPPKAVLRDSDIYVDRLCEGVSDLGATLLVAHVSRYVVDLNRAADDIDTHAVPSHPRSRMAQPRGVIWRAATDGSPVLRAPLTKEQYTRRIELFHTPYHRVLSEQVDQIRSRHGHAVLLAAHSMPSVGRSFNGATQVRRADIVPGTRGQSSADRRVIELVERHFVEAGLSVSHDDPYQGGWTTSHYGRPREGVHALQLEINRALYVDEANSEIRVSEFDRLRSLLAELVDKLGALEL